MMTADAPDDIDLRTAQRLAARLLELNLKAISVESCTGGMVAATLTSLPGSSDWFEGAFVTYRLSAKTRMVGVPQSMLDTHGAVSEPVARAMAEGALKVSDADLSVAITGVAGPSGGDVVTPVGTVWFAWAVREPEVTCVQTVESQFSGDRNEVRVQATNLAIAGLLRLLD